MSLVWAILLFTLLLIFWGMTVVGMPGNWLIVAASGLFAYLGPVDGRLAISGLIVAILLCLALPGEGVEMLASALGVAKVGGSRRSAVLALLGAMIGGVIGVFAGTPVPVVGSLVAALLFASMGALAGAMLGESWKGQSIRESWPVGKAAFWARLLGTLAKTTIGAVMVAVTAAALVLN